MTMNDGAAAPSVLGTQEPCLSIEAENEEGRKQGPVPNETLAHVAATTDLRHDDGGAGFPPVSVCGDSSVEDDLEDFCGLLDDPVLLSMDDDIPESELGEFLLDAVEWL